MFLLFIINLIQVQSEQIIDEGLKILSNTCMSVVRQKLDKDHIQIIDQIEDEEQLHEINIQYFEHCMKKLSLYDKIQIASNNRFGFLHIFDNFQLQRWNKNYQLTEQQQFYSSFIKSYDYEQMVNSWSESIQVNDEIIDEEEQFLYFSKFRLFLILIWIYVISICSCIFLRRRRYLKKTKN